MRSQAKCPAPPSQQHRSHQKGNGIKCLKAHQCQAGPGGGAGYSHHRPQKNNIANLKNHAEKHIADTQQTTPTHTPFCIKYWKLLKNFKNIYIYYIKKLKYNYTILIIYIYWL